MKRQIRWVPYSIMLMFGLSIFVTSIYAAFNYILETSKTSAVNQAYDYFILLKAHHYLDRLANRLQLASVDANTIHSSTAEKLELTEQLGITWSRVNDLTIGTSAERMKLLSGLPELTKRIEIAFTEMEDALTKDNPDYRQWYFITNQLTNEFNHFTNSPTGLLAIQRELQQSEDLMNRYFIGISISGVVVLLIYSFALVRTIAVSRGLIAANLQLELEGEQLRQIKEALLEQVEALFYQASHDPLTNLINRHELEQRLQGLLQSAKQNNEQHALCYIDVDQFKVINDVCGHSAGDRLLRQLTVQLSQQMRPQDTLSRLGGDEFAVLMKNCSLAEAERIAESLRRTVQSFRFSIENKAFNVSMSVGVVRINSHSTSPMQILGDADAACYIAKENGRNRVHAYTSNDQTVQRHKDEMAWVARIKNAFEEKRFTLYYQPIVPIRKPPTDKEHYEILVRMIDEKGEIIAPGAFLPAAERYSFMPSLDRWVVETLFSWLATHPEKLEKLTLCAINFSAVSISEKAFSGFLVEKMRYYQIPPEKLCFEVTETATIANLKDASKFIKVIKEQGCYFALDDFGSGMSSFGYLKNLPVDFLKIDGGFVKNMVTSGTDHVMVEAIHRVGHVMGLKTIAEYVENDDILRKLRMIGVDYAQGFGIAKPAPLMEKEIT